MSCNNGSSLGTVFRSKGSTARGCFDSMKGDTSVAGGSLREIAGSGAGSSKVCV